MKMGAVPFSFTGRRNPLYCGAMMRRSFLLLSFLLFAGVNAHGQDDLVPEVRLISVQGPSESVTPGKPFHLTFQVAVDPGWHIYGTKDEFSPTMWEFEGAEVSGNVEEPQGKRKKDELGNRIELDGEITFKVPVR